MTSREKKEMLSKYRAAVREVERLELEISRWRSKAEKMSAEIHLAPAGGGNGRSMENAIAKIESLTAKLWDQRAEMVELRNRIGDAISAVSDDRLKDLLRLRYIEGLTLERIAEDMNYSFRQVTRMHGQALEKIKMS